MTIKSEFFHEGFVTKLPILSRSRAQAIDEEYKSFLETETKKWRAVEHKSKTHLFFDWANEIVHDEKLLDYVSQILGKNIYCWNSLIFYKPPFSSVFVSPHQDQNYWNVESDKALSVQLAISDSLVDNGCLQILPKSHLINYAHLDLSDRNNMLARGQTVELDKAETNKMENIELSQGECVIFHGNVVHGSMPNTSNRHRLNFTIRFLTPDNKIDTTLYYNHATLVKGRDDFGHFVQEVSCSDVSNEKRRKIHKRILLQQFERYLRLQVKNSVVTAVLMQFFKFGIFRSFAYFLAKKT